MALGAALLVLQALAAGPALRHAAGADAATIARAGYCEPHRHDGTPLPAGEDHAPCCLFCVAGRDGPAALPALFSGDTAAPALAFIPLAYDRHERPDGRPAGWASSWSSRAPPLG